MLVVRTGTRQQLEQALARAPVVLLVGARQVGKSTLAREVSARRASTYFDLENPRHASRLADPLLALEHLDGLVVIDEAQRARDLFPVLRVLADRRASATRFLVLGSASPDLVGLAAESLAGRVEILEIGGLQLADVGAGDLDRLWLHGGYPRAFTSDPVDANAWLDNYITTFLERDLPQLGFRLPAAQMRRFWTMVAHYHAQTWNGSELSRSLGVAATTVRRYLDALTDALVVRQLQPWFTNTSKRLVRSPKVYLRDSGVLHRLLSIDSRESLLSHPKVGASWEGLVVEQLAAVVGPRPLYFWGTQRGAELDVLTVIDGRSIGVEVKRSSQPRVTPSMRSALADLDLHRLVVAYAGPDRFPLAERVEAVPVAELLTGGLDVLAG